MKQTMCLTLAVTAAVLLLAACGARKAAPVEETRATDSQLSCAHLSAERQVNLARARDLLKEKGDQEANNIGLLLLSPFLLDLSNTEKKEIEALHRRNQRLDGLMIARKCETAAQD